MCFLIESKRQLQHSVFFSPFLFTLPFFSQLLSPLFFLSHVRESYTLKNVFLPSLTSFPYLLSLCFIPSLFTVVSVFCCVFHSLSNIVSVCCCVFHSVSNTVSVLCCGFHSLSNNYCLYLLLCVSFPLYEYLPPSFFVCFIPLCNVFVSSLNRPCLSLRSPGSFHL